MSELRKVENHCRGTLKAFGLKVGSVSQKEFEQRDRALVSGHAMLAKIAEVVLSLRRLLLKKLEAMDRMVLETVSADPASRLLMTTSGVGPATALTYRVASDAPARFVRSRAVGAYLGITPRRYQAVEMD